MSERTDDIPPLEEQNRHTEAALLRHKLEGVDMAVKARWVALAVVAVMLPFLNPQWEVIYYHFLLGLMALIGLVQRRVAQVGQSRRELLVLAADLTLMGFILLAPNPFSDDGFPTAMPFHFSVFQYFYIILAAGTLAYSWRTIGAIGNWTAIVWATGVGLIWYFGVTYPEVTDALFEAFGKESAYSYILDPNSIQLERRVQEVVVFVIVAFTLAMTVRRFNRLLLNNAQLERERENLSRYFSPNVVEELSKNDEPLKQTRNHEVAVLFVDIQGFTKLASNRDPGEVIDLLRGFHARMEAEVFRHGGTLDKYLGDGLMATFGTPMPSEQDALNALRCARSMTRVLADWNAERRSLGEPEIKGSFGLHYGPVVLGDIGANRLEFAVIGNTVNIASRFEQLTREIHAEMAVSENLIDRARSQTIADDPVFGGMVRHRPRKIRGLEEPMAAWALDRPSG